MLTPTNPNIMSNYTWSNLFGCGTMDAMNTSEDAVSQDVPPMVQEVSGNSGVRSEAA